jgi:hypothetical protein
LSKASGQALKEGLRQVPRERKTEVFFREIYPTKSVILIMGREKFSFLREIKIY